MKTEFIVRTAAGRAVLTSSDADLALKFARDKRGVYPGLTVDSETTTVIKRRLWTDRRAGARLTLIAGGAR